MLLRFSGMVFASIRYQRETQKVTLALQEKPRRPISSFRFVILTHHVLSIRAIKQTRAHVVGLYSYLYLRALRLLRRKGSQPVNRAIINTVGSKE